MTTAALTDDGDKGLKDKGACPSGTALPALRASAPSGLRGVASHGAFVPVCTNRSRPNLANDHSKGHQWWGREVHHLEAAGQHYSTGKQTLCGRDSTDWLTIEAEVDLADRNLCVRCAAKARAAQ